MGFGRVTAFETWGRLVNPPPGAWFLKDILFELISQPLVFEGYPRFGLGED